jgi:hypothetical protein
LTEAIKLRAEVVLGAVLLPQPRHEDVNLTGRVGIDALEPTGEVDIGIDSVQAT